MHRSFFLLTAALLLGASPLSLAASGFSAKSLGLDAERFDRFVDGLSSGPIAVVSVHGMVCDFCARGIAKTFRRDKRVQKVLIDLDKSVVLVAYRPQSEPDEADIRSSILRNGQEVTALRMIRLQP